MRKVVAIGCSLALMIVYMGAVMSEELSLVETASHPFIQVQGTGRVTLPPDIATLSLGVEAQAKTAADARKQAAGAMQAMIAALRGLDVPDKDIRTQHFGLNPVYASDRAGKIGGYSAQQNLLVKLRKLETVGSVIDEALKAAGDAGRMYGLTFGIDDLVHAQSEARAKACADAKDKAEELAAAAGVGLGRPLRIIEQSGSSLPFSADVSMNRMAAAAATPIAVGEQEVSVNVEVRYSIQVDAPKGIAPSTSN